MVNKPTSIGLSQASLNRLADVDFVRNVVPARGVWKALDEALTGLRPKALSPAPAHHFTGPRRIIHTIVRPIGRCQFCQNPGAMVLKRGELERVEYCADHWDYCNVKTGTHRCECGANHTTKDGIRICHHHSRSMKEVYSDKTLEAAGFLILKVASG